eukprot:NODE_569_length_2922_cov_6.441145.p1 GENE.NODE_569_length_2922_cov_6.441145~~NODE_569_length_2922_cov_6.441145.p1  ORF type:complete len:723 (+),score=216.88 NODE_569_length_2922_cov_6.441145:713-2881(+)
MPELFYEPSTVFSAEVARRHIAALAGEEEAPAEETPPAAAEAAGVYVADPFAELIATVLAWLHRSLGVLDQEAVLLMIKALRFKPRAVIAALSREVFWSHAEADCEILLRTAMGAAQHPRPLPGVYLHHQVHQSLVAQVRQMGARAKLDKLSHALHWTVRSELSKAYGTLRIVLMGLREIFYDPTRLYLKRALDGVVEWPVGRGGRIGPQDAEAPACCWTPAVDDVKASDDPKQLNAKRQVLGAVMSHGGCCDVALLRQLLQQVDGCQDEELRAFFTPGSPLDLAAVLFWAPDRVHFRLGDQGLPAHAREGVEEGCVPPSLRKMLRATVEESGSASIAELKALLVAAGHAVPDDMALALTLQSVPEFFFMPNIVFLKHMIKPLIAGIAEHAKPEQALTGGSARAVAGGERKRAEDGEAAATVKASDAGLVSQLSLGKPATAEHEEECGHDTDKEAAELKGSGLDPDGQSDPRQLSTTDTTVDVPPQKGLPERATAIASDAKLPLGSTETVPPDASPGAPPEVTSAATLEHEANAARSRATTDADGGSVPQFFSFDDFALRPDATIIERRPVKRRRLIDDDEEEDGDRRSGRGTAAWNQEAPPWATESAAVVVRAEEGEFTGAEGVVVKASGATCTVRFPLGVQARGASGGLAGGGLAVDHEFPTPALLPVVPKVGATVKVVEGGRAGCFGTLVGLVGTDGVVQIGKMSYETLPMSYLVTVML